MQYNILSENIYNFDKINLILNLTAIAKIIICIEYYK